MKTLLCALLFPLTTIGAAIAQAPAPAKTPED